MLAWGLAHLSSWATVSGVALVLPLVAGALLALPDVRRWCPTTD